MSHMGQYEAHVAFLKKRGEYRIDRVKARIKRHMKAQERAFDEHDRYLARVRLVRAEKRLRFTIQDIADDIKAYTRCWSSTAPVVPAAPSILDMVRARTFRS